MHQKRWLAPVCLTLLVVSGCAQIPTTPEPPQFPTTAQAGNTTIVAVAPQQQQKPCCSIWDFLGVRQIFGGLRLLGTRIRSRLGSRFPGLEPRPPLLTITDPANLGPEASPAVQTAAEVKAEEDQAAQKAKAINYLAMMGCGGCDRGIEEALMAALDDCTEEVRYAAAKAFRDLSGSPCAVCKTDACCSEAALKKLSKMANDTKNGCYVEPSPRVRRVARLAVAGCGGYIAGAEPAESVPEEGPTPADLPAGGAGAEGGVEARSILRGGRTVQAGAAQARPDDSVLAEVNGEAIYKSDVEPLVAERLQSVRGFAGMTTTDAMRRAVQQRELEQLIEKRILFQEARRNLPDAQINQVAYQTLLSPGRRPERILADMGRHQAADKGQLIRALLEQKVVINLTVSDHELRRYYHDNLPEYQSSASVRWEEITVPVGRDNSSHHGQSVIRYLHAVSQGKPTSPAPVFHRQNVITRAHAFTQISQIPSRRLTDRLMNLPKGRISEPWQDETGWHLTRVIERRPGRTMPLEEVHESVRDAILKQRRAAAERQYVAILRQQAQVWTVFQGNDRARQNAATRENAAAGGNAAGANMEEGARVKAIGAETGAVRPPAAPALPVTSPAPTASPAPAESAVLPAPAASAAPRAPARASAPRQQLKTRRPEPSVRSSGGSASQPLMNRARPASPAVIPVATPPRFPPRLPAQ